ncbi:2-oxo acid dehydrogenase subunit E2 [Brevibacillus sp. SYP-B805]|uniref:dihydrolipoamide acetyltransferase family protein n=1 Tax=Brevibacillus sp. SYP-B805 TaxID=1578199 RepID=UPI0013E9CC29|nr:dihydrolipoamide acetyltransferase family protein [Brevibacillus sp. SYP-B805]NGQ96040.1 2-oxo acid dehydrogenase subunit E2 [Brevibacillus sp. SYP-B805]
MATGVFMPKLSMTMEQGTIIQWFKQEGDDVREGELLLEVMTDKINIEVEAYATGKLLKIYYGANQTVPVNQIIAYIGEADEVVPEHPPALDETARQAAEAGANEPGAAAAPETAAQEQKIRATPVARRIARENGLALEQIKGSGPNGRIHRIDVEQALARRSAQAAPPVKEPIRSSAPSPLRQRKLEGMRRVIAQRMAQSAFTAPHVTLTTEADMSRAIELRTELLPAVEKATGLRLSYTEVIVKAVATALVRHPHINVSLQDDVLIERDEVNVGLAVAVPDGLLVPVVKHADRRGLAELTAECKRLAGLAREGKLLPDDMRGGSFTISNLGMYAIDAFTPIINPPEIAILGVGRIHEKPVGVNGQILLRPMMTLSLSFDHRAVDGAPAAAFLQEIKEILESPWQLLV